MAAEERTPGAAIPFDGPKFELAPAAQAPDVPGNPTKGLPVLIAEDDGVSRDILANWLRKWGYEVVVANNGSEAMAVMRGANPPTLAILDWMMPEMDGIEVCRRLRSINKAVYIIILTALTDKEKIVEGLEAGADDYLTKPYDHHELMARVRAGARIAALQTSLAQRVKELEDASEQMTQLRKMYMPL